MNSIQNQEYKDIEHIIVDNMSDDGTYDLVVEYKRNAPYDVIYIREHDTGIYNAMNKGIEKSNGTWVHILNSDDQYAGKTVLKELFSRIDIDGYDILVNPIMTGENGRSLWTPEFIEKINHYKFPHPGSIVKKEFYNNYGLYSERYKIISDAIWQIRNFPKSKYIILEKPLVIMSQGGISSKISIVNMIEPIICTLFYHKYPFYYKIKRTIDYMYGPIDHLIKKYLTPVIWKFKGNVKKMIRRN